MTFICNKVKFDTERRANRALLQAKIARDLRRSTSRREQRVYLCRCGSWHMTSTEFRPSVKGTQ